MVKRTTQIILLVLGWISLALGLVGVFIPILPTTPFVLLAAFFFSKGSENIHNWLINNKLFGKMILDWEKKGVIGKKSKVWASCMIIPLFSLTTILVNIHLSIKIVVIIIGITVLAFIWLRPEE